MSKQQEWKNKQAELKKERYNDGNIFSKSSDFKPLTQVAEECKLSVTKVYQIMRRYAPAYVMYGDVFVNKWEEAYQKYCMSKIS